MNTQHTPAPWYVDSRNPLCVDIYNGTIDVSMDDDHLNLIGKANAKLIADSPEMLSLLKGIIAEIDGEGNIKRDSEHIINARYLIKDHA